MGQQFLNIRSTKIKVGQNTNDIQADNTIVLNASNDFINVHSANATYIAPVRQFSSSYTTFIGYDRNTNEIIDTGIKTSLLDGLSSSNTASSPVEFTNALKIEDIQNDISIFKTKIDSIENDTRISDTNKYINEVKSGIINYLPEINSIKNTVYTNESIINDIRIIENDTIEKIKSLESSFFKQITVLPSVKNDILTNTSKITKLENKYVDHLPDIHSIKNELSKINNSINCISREQECYKKTDANLIKIMDRTDILETTIPQIQKLELSSEKIPELLRRTNDIEHNIPRVSILETITTDTNKEISKINDRTTFLENTIPRITLLEKESINISNSLKSTTDRVDTIENKNYFENYFKSRPESISFKDCDIIVGSTHGSSLKKLQVPSNSQGKILCINNDISNLEWTDIIHVKKITSNIFCGDGSNINNLDINTVSKGILSVEYGGTGIKSFSTGDILYAGNQNNFIRLPVNKNGFLTCTDTSIKWSKNIEENNSNIHINSSLITNDIEVNGTIKQKSKPVFSVSLLNKIASQRKTVLWDTIDLNITNSFIDNAFVTPVSGYYSFSLRIVTNGCTLLNVELRKNDIGIEKCNYFVHESSTEIPLSNSTILQLYKNDRITVHILSGQMANYKNEFCGYLIEAL